MTPGTNQNDSDAILERSVSHLRGLAIRIQSVAQMRGEFNHERLGSLEQRLTWIEQASGEIADELRKFYPNQPVLAPAQNLNWKTSL